MARREAMAIVVTRCLSPLGTGNDETGSLDSESTSNTQRTARLRSRPPLWKSVSMWRSSTAIGDRINMPSRKIPESCLTSRTAMSAAARSVSAQAPAITPQFSQQEGHP